MRLLQIKEDILTARMINTVIFTNTGVRNLPFQGQLANYDEFQQRAQQ
jgi:hypothetical protein